MDGQRYLAVSIGCLLAVTAATAQAPDDPLAGVKRLYASAFYEDALVALEQVSGETDANQIDEYRALCFLGLDRIRDAEQALERLVMRSPSSMYDLASHPPKFVTLYRAVRKRTLPIAAAVLYRSAKANFERGELVTASAQFKQVLVLLSDAEDATMVGDLRMLADGFSRLSEQRPADVSPPAPPPLPPENVLAASSPKRSKGVYGSEDLDVIPPVIIDQRMPAWIPRSPFLASRMFHGTLEVIVGEDGAVESRIMSEPTFPSYDWELLNAAKQWRYRPATRDGWPVKYRKVIAVTLGGSVRNQ